MPSILYLGNTNHEYEFQKVVIVCVEMCVRICVFQMSQVVISSRDKIQWAGGKQFPGTLEGLLPLHDHAAWALTLPTGLVHCSHLGNKCRLFMPLLDAKSKRTALCCTLLDKYAHSVNRVSNYIPCGLCGGFWLQELEDVSQNHPYLFFQLIIYLLPTNRNKTPKQTQIASCQQLCLKVRWFLRFKLVIKIRFRETKALKFLAWPPFFQESRIV